jgi:hypothetical protein
MADADEELRAPLDVGADYDPSEEPQDFRFLEKLT